MPYYLFPILAFFTFLMESQERKNDAYKFLFYFTLIAISAVACFRGVGMGTDYWQYRGYFVTGWISGYDVGFNIITWSLRALGSSVEVCFSFFFLSSLFLKIYVFKRMSYSLILSLMTSFGFWFLVYDMNGIRQGLSISVLSLAIYAAYKENLKNFVIFTIIASSIHFASIIFLPFYFILKLKIPKRMMLILIAIVFLLTLSGISDFLFSILSSGSGDNVFAEKTDAYSKNDAFNADALFSFGSIHRLIIFAVTLFTVHKIPADKRMKDLFMVSAFLSIVMYLLFSKIELIATRTSLPFRFVECIFFSYLPFVSKHKIGQIIIALVLLAYILLQVFLIVSVPDGNLVPYRSIFD
jgi:hypothetical protein